MHDLPRTLESLKALRRERGDSSPFGSHTAFLRWSDQVLPLLAFDEKLAAEFKQLVEAATAVEDWRPERYAPNVNNAVGCVTRAIALLELASAPATAHNASVPAPTPPPLGAPEKVTVKWLYEHAPWSFYVWFFGALAGAFAAGFSASELLTTMKNTNLSAAAPTTIRPTSASAPSKSASQP